MFAREKKVSFLVKSDVDHVSVSENRIVSVCLDAESPVSRRSFQCLPIGKFFCPYSIKVGEEREERG